MSKVFNTSLRFTDIIIGQAIRAYSTVGACTHLSLLYRTKISSTVGGTGKWPEKLNRSIQVLIITQLEKHLWGRCGEGYGRIHSLEGRWRQPFLQLNSRICVHLGKCQNKKRGGVWDEIEATPKNQNVRHTWTSSVYEEEPGGWGRGAGEVVVVGWLDARTAPLWRFGRSQTQYTGHGGVD